MINEFLPFNLLSSVTFFVLALIADCCCYCPSANKTILFNGEFKELIKIEKNTKTIVIYGLYIDISTTILYLILELYHQQNISQYDFSISKI